jgi:hypothetical protein
VSSSGERSRCDHEDIFIRGECLVKVAFRQTRALADRTDRYVPIATLAV